MNRPYTRIFENLLFTILLAVLIGSTGAVVIADRSNAQLHAQRETMEQVAVAARASLSAVRAAASAVQAP